MAGEITSYRLRKRYLHADGHASGPTSPSSLVRNARGKPLHFVSHVADLTEELEAAARIEEINRELSEQKARLERSNADLEAFAMLAATTSRRRWPRSAATWSCLEASTATSLDDRANDWIGRATQAADRMSRAGELAAGVLPRRRSRPLTSEMVSVPELVERGPPGPRAADHRDGRRGRGRRPTPRSCSPHRQPAAPGPPEPDPEHAQVPARPTGRPRCGWTSRSGRRTGWSR